MHVGLSLLTLHPGRAGGAETYVRGLLGAYADGHGPDRVTVLANRHVAEAYGEYERGPVRIVEVPHFRAGGGTPTRAAGLLHAALRPGAVARGVPAGIDVLHHAVTVPVPRTGAPSVVTVHDLQHHDLDTFAAAVPRPFGGLEKAFRRWSYDGATRRATVAITLSTFAAERLAALGLAPELVRVIPPGLDPRFTAVPQRDDADRRARLGVDDRAVLHVARPWPHKEHETLIEAFARVRDPGLTLHLVGVDGRSAARLRSHAARAGVAARVRTHGLLDGPTLAALYRGAALTVVPSTYETFGLPVLEAFGCGCPVAVARAGALPEVAGDAALVFPPGDRAAIASAIDRVAADEDLGRRLREAGRVRAAAATWAASAAAHTRALWTAADAAPVVARAGR